MQALCRPRTMVSIAAMLFLSNGNMFGMASSVTDLSSRNVIDPLTQGSHRDMVGIDTANNRNSNNTLQSWDINYVNFTADLSRDDELEMYLEITKGRSYESELLGGDCAENITGIDYNTTTPVVTSKSDTHDYLRLGYSINKSMINGSSIWNDTSDKIEVCQIVRLVLVTDETPPMTMIIAQIKNQFIINVDFSMNFTVAAYLKYVGMKLTMTIPGELELGAYVIPDNQEDVNNDAAIFEKTITEGAQGAIGPNTSWAVVNTTINTIGESNVTTDTRRLSDVDNAAFDAPGGEQRGLQSTTMVKFDLFLEEPCDDMDDCKELMTTTNMYADVWSHMNGTVFDGGFFDILNAVALKASSVTRERTLMQEDAIDAVAAGDEDHHRSLQLNMTDIEVRRLTLYDPTMAVWEPISNIGTASGSTDVFSYVRACKCDGAQYFNCNENVPLAPNNELFVCIWSIRSSEVEIDYLDSMTLTQDGNDLPIIASGNVRNPQISSREYVPTKDGVVAATFVPLNMFNFSEDKSITIAGQVVMKLANDGTRRLQFATSDSAGNIINENAPFQVKISLTGDKTASPAREEDDWTSSSASILSVSKGVAAILGVFFGFC